MDIETALAIAHDKDMTVEACDKHAASLDWDADQLLYGHNNPSEQLQNAAWEKRQTANIWRRVADIRTRS